MKLTVLPLTPERWPDLEAIFNAKGCGLARTCWCMYFRRSGAAPGHRRADENRADLQALVESGPPPGLIGYSGKVPVGWVALAPRDAYPRLARSPVRKAVDDKPVWSIVCFVVPSEHRGQGVAQAVLGGAIAYARKCGATLIEAYPVDRATRGNDDAMWFGTKSMYDKAGFTEVARRRPGRPVVRLRTSCDVGSRKD